MNFRAILSTLFTLPLVASLHAGVKTVSFDDLSTGELYANIQNGYEGLQWYYFGVINGSARPPSEGYRTGVISPHNVAFNLSGSPAWVGCGNPFDLISTHLTAHVINGMQIRIQGFANGEMLYDTTHTVVTTGPTTVSLNYVGVDRVTFTPSPGSPFAMDDLVVNLPASPTAPAQTVECSAIGHRFSNPNFRPPPFPQFPVIVSDLLVDQGQTPAGIGVLSPWWINFDEGEPISLTVTAPPGQRFQVEPPSGRSVRFSGALSWGYNQNGGPVISSPVAVTFTGLEGTAPDFSSTRAVLAPYHGYFGFDAIQSSEFSERLRFKSITFTTSLSSSYTNSGALNYTPIHSGTFGLLYTMTETNDPGSFVSLVASEEPPALQITVLGTGTVHVRWVTADGGFYLESADTMPAVNWDRVLNEVSVAGDERSVMLPVVQTTRFFRLRKD